MNSMKICPVPSTLTLRKTVKIMFYRGYVHIALVIIVVEILITTVIRTQKKKRQHNNNNNNNNNMDGNNNYNFISLPQPNFFPSIIISNYYSNLYSEIILELF